MDILFPRETPPQKRIRLSQARFNVACFGRQSGKTTYGINKLVWKPLMGRRGGIYWHVLQTYGAAEIAFDRMDRLLWRTDIIRKRSNQSDLCQFLRNDVNIFFKSGDKPHNLRAETLDGGIIDECREQSKIIWSQIMMPMLGRYNGWCDFLSTPNGYDWFYDLYEQARLHNPLGEWDTFHSPSTEAWWWTPNQIEQARASMSDDEFSQEIMAEFKEIGTGKAYISHGKHNEATQNPFAPTGAIISPYLPVTVVLDFNVNPMSWTLGQFKGPDSYWFDEINVANTNTQLCAPELVNRLLELKRIGQLKANPSVTLIGDATGESRNTKATESDYAIIGRALKDAGITYVNKTPESNPLVKTRVNTVNARLKAADGSVHLWYHPVHCKKLGRDFSRVTWKEGAHFILDQSKDKTLTHPSDGVGYGICVMAPLESLQPIYGAYAARR